MYLENREAVGEQLKNEMKEKLKDPAYLPSRADVKLAFGNKWTEEWHRYFFNNTRSEFELLTKEFVNALRDYLVQRLKELKISEDQPIKILEVGAGRGRLAHFLQSALEEAAPGRFSIIATDSGKDARTRQVDFPVVKVDLEKSLAQYQPDVVLSSWMPPHVDWTPMFRKQPTVKEYLLIGDWEICGSKSTLGNYKDFSQEKLASISQTQICRTDQPDTEESHSSTISFRRNK